MGSYIILSSDPRYGNIEAGPISTGNKNAILSTFDIFQNVKYGLDSSVYIILSSDPRYGNLMSFNMGRVRLVLAFKMLNFNGALSETRTSLRHLPRKDSKPHFLAQYPPRKTLSPGKPSPCIASFSMLVVEGFVCIYIILSSDPRYGNFI